MCHHAKAARRLSSFGNKPEKSRKSRNAGNCHHRLRRAATIEANTLQGTGNKNRRDEQEPLVRSSTFPVCILITNTDSRSVPLPPARAEAGWLTSTKRKRTESETKGRSHGREFYTDEEHFCLFLRLDGSILEVA
ncbi:hypothetical protein SKAU_G00315000 [Synaphobranchus kaupii]|uniref:Uncharacterized protein n=1 Tax=Synaphobranchus kaupii TaxID=118154 RepID=A0A9Q1IKN9_SYNKA|nr:hypothetical protein SKAU_G00315000 [Synaphobranchus kaupii]